ncbi:hypothetical protein JW824_07830 [bacterium]|nr:hypothetical protein [bacterium]
MARGARSLIYILFCLMLIASLLIGGCSRYANEEQITTLDETEAAALAAEQKVAEKEKEKAELEAKLAEKQQELEYVKSEKAKVQSRL